MNKCLCRAIRIESLFMFSEKKSSIIFYTKTCNSYDQSTKCSKQVLYCHIWVTHIDSINPNFDILWFSLSDTKTNLVILEGCIPRKVLFCGSPFGTVIVFVSIFAGSWGFNSIVGLEASFLVSIICCRCFNLAKLKWD